MGQAGRCIVNDLRIHNYEVANDNYRPEGVLRACPGTPDFGEGILPDEGLCGKKWHPKPPFWHSQGPVKVLRRPGKSAFSSNESKDIPRFSF